MIEQQLLKNGWDRSAVRRFESEMKKQSQTTENSEQVSMEKLIHDAQVVGSDMYTKLYRATQQTARERLSMVLDQLGAVIDEYNFLQLTSKKFSLSEEISPHAPFLALFRQDVCRAFATKKGLNNDELGHKIHLFRSYLDRQLLSYIRLRYEGQTDVQKLTAYQAHMSFRFDYSTGARYHNRTMGQQDYPKNMKILVPKYRSNFWLTRSNARMSEFIIDTQTGMFVTQWDRLKKGANGCYDSRPEAYSLEDFEVIANTESFNYGKSFGQNWDIFPWDHHHQSLDVNYPLNPDVRKQALRFFPSPQTIHSNGTYVDLFKKEQDYVVWQRISEEQRCEMYQDFCRYILQTKRNPGIAAFLRQVPKNKRIM